MKTFQVFGLLLLLACGANAQDRVWGTATVAKKGVVKPDGSTITIDADGTIHGGGGPTNGQTAAQVAGQIAATNNTIILPSTTNIVAAGGRLWTNNIFFDGDADTTYHVTNETSMTVGSADNDLVVDLPPPTLGRVFLLNTIFDTANNHSVTVTSEGSTLTNTTAKGAAYIFVACDHGFDEFWDIFDCSPHGSVPFSKVIPGTTTNAHTSFHIYSGLDPNEHTEYDHDGMLAYATNTHNASVGFEDFLLCYVASQKEDIRAPTVRARGDNAIIELLPSAGSSGGVTTTITTNGIATGRLNMGTAWVTNFVVATNATGGTAVDFSNSECTTNLAGNLTLSSLTNLTMGAYNRKLMHCINTNVVDRTVTIPTGWGQGLGDTFVVTNGTRKDIMIVCQPGVFTNAFQKDIIPH